LLLIVAAESVAAESVATESVAAEVNLKGKKAS